MNINDLLRFQDDNSKQLYLSTIGDLSGVISNPTTGNNGSYLVSGGQVIWRTGLDFTITAATYYILGTFYESPETDVTLSPADATNDRIDTFYVNTSSTAGVITGTPSSDPQETSVDPETQLRLTIVLIESTATTPSGVSNEIIYDEDAGTPSEWATSTNNATVVDFADTADPANNTIHTTISANNTSYYMRYTPASAATINAEEDKLVLSIKLLERFRRNQFLSIQFYDPTAGVILNANLRPGQFGLDGNNTSTYQEITIPIIAMYPYEPVTYTGVSQLTIVVPAQTDNLDYQLDYIYLQKGITSPTFGNADSHHIFKNTIWVDGNGNDDTGEKGEFNKPFATIKAAENIASSGDTIIVMPGTYSANNLGKDGLVYHLHAGAKILGEPARNIFSDKGSAMSFRVTGHGELETTTGRLFGFSNNSTTVYVSILSGKQTSFSTSLDPIFSYATLYLNVEGSLENNANNWYLFNTFPGSKTYFTGNYISSRCRVVNNRGLFYYSHNYTQVFSSNTYECAIGSNNVSAYFRMTGGKLRIDNGGANWTGGIAPESGVLSFEGVNIIGTCDNRPMIDVGHVSTSGSTAIVDLHNCIVEVEASVNLPVIIIRSATNLKLIAKDTTFINHNTGTISGGVQVEKSDPNGNLELTNCKFLLNSTAVSAGAKAIRDNAAGTVYYKAFTDIVSNGAFDGTNLISHTVGIVDANAKSD